LRNNQRRLSFLTWTEIQNYLERSKTIIIPIGSTEQHGPTGAIGTDALTADAIANRVAQETNTIVTPVLSYGMAQHHLAFPGTMSLRPSTFQMMLHDLIFSLVSNGFEKIFVVNGHGGNIASTKAAFSEVYRTVDENKQIQHKGFKCKLYSWFLLPEVRKLAFDLYGQEEGQHATPSEIAITLTIDESLIAKNIPLPAPAPSGPIYDKNDFKSRYPDGRMGSVPYLAKKEHGKLLLELSARILTKALIAFNNEK